MYIALVLIVVAIAAVAFVILQNSSFNTKNNNGSSTGNPIAIFNTSLGTFKVELFRDKMPITVNNFVKLVNDGFYNGMIFYRISDNFMIQAGRYFPNGTEKFSPYGNVPFETSDVKHVDGAISMASTGAKTGGSAEFFICDGIQSSLDGNYAAFGVTIEGIEVVRNIASQPQDNSNPAGGGKPYTDIVIKSITIE
jgi:peptidyl-prolyl cis-trans isomerase A (cyclophilin A)